jgi:hypothetical protein
MRIERTLDVLTWIVLSIAIGAAALATAFGIAVGGMGDPAPNFGMLPVVGGFGLLFISFFATKIFSDSAAIAQMFGFCFAAAAGFLYWQSVRTAGWTPQMWWMFVGVSVSALACTGFAIIRLWYKLCRRR